MNITILGGGAWGTAVAIALCRHHRVTLWVRNSQQLSALQQQRRNEYYLPGHTLPDPLRIEELLPRALADAELTLFAVPSAAFRLMLRDAKAAGLKEGVIWACKGFEPHTAMLPHQVADAELQGVFRCAVLAGPSFAQEVAAGLPTAIALASNDAEFARHAAAQLHTARLRIYTSTDVLGVELGGAVKNVLAIAAGISDGMGFGYNARAAMITRGLAEITRLGIKLGGKLETFMGLSGLGDLILTCTGDLSRNRQVGLQLAQGRPLAMILQHLGHIAEGVYSAREVKRLASAAHVDMPISDAVFRVLYDGCSPKRAVEELLSRELKVEGNF
ncbi:MAG: NAD(P)H-dependent glycerol-3-phosphate dehydrogenase [Burkholderiales bacterium]